MSVDGSTLNHIRLKYRCAGDCCVGIRCLPYVAFICTECCFICFEPHLILIMSSFDEALLDLLFSVQGITTFCQRSNQYTVVELINSAVQNGGSPLGKFTNI